MTYKYLVNSLLSQRDIVILVSSVLAGTGQVFKVEKLLY